MSQRIKIGSRVSTEAWRFDRKTTDIEERWSYLQFGDNYMNARVLGTVQGKSGNRWVVKWDIDKQITSWETELLFKEPDTIPLQG